MIIEMLTAGVITAGSGRGFVVEGARAPRHHGRALPTVPPAGPVLFRAQGAQLRTAPRPPRERAPRVGGLSLCRSDRRHRGARFARQFTRRCIQSADGDGDGAFDWWCPPEPSQFLGTGPAAVSRRPPMVLLYNPPLRRATVDHPRG